MISGCQPRGGLATCRRLPVAGPAILECLSTPKSTARALLVEVLADRRRVAALFAVDRVYSYLPLHAGYRAAIPGARHLRQSPRRGDSRTAAMDACGSPGGRMP